MAPLMVTGRGRLAVRGEVVVPGDKSVSHRALMLSTLAEGASRISGILRSADVESTARVLRSLGASVPELSREMVMRGRGPAAFRASSSELDCGNSGTTARLMMGIAAGLPFTSTFTGDQSLSRRPMRRVAAPVIAMGASVEFLRGRDGLPLRVLGGNLHGIEWRLESASAQVKSAILLAAVCAGVKVIVVEPECSRDHTERLLRLQGLNVVSENGRVALETPGPLASLDVDVPGDPSSAAFFAALGALSDEGEITLRGVGLNPLRTGFLGVLRRMGAEIAIEHVSEAGAEPVGDLSVRSAGLRGTTVGTSEIPSLIDELPVLACVAARAEGETTITGAEELRVKESDRISAVVANLRATGVDAEELPDGMRIRGTRRPLSGTVTTHGDHRLAMAFAVLGATAHAEIALDDPGCVSVSYPNFWRELARLIVRG